MEGSIPSSHAFWETQPVPQLGECGDLEEGQIDVDKTPAEIRVTPYSLSKGFEWCTVDIHKQEEAQEVYRLLEENYVEDDDSSFRFAYSVEFLQWALCPPHYRPEYIIGVRAIDSRKLVGFITAVPQIIVVKDKPLKMVDVNFLCVHKKIRSKRLAPVLIKEITRRVNRNDGWQAIYTAGAVIPTAICNATYYHRSLNAKKLVDIGFCRIPSRMTLTSYLRLHRVPEEASTPGIRYMKKGDVKAVTVLLNNYLKQFTVYPIFTAEEVEHFFMPVEGVVSGLVVEDPETKKITDFISFFHVQSTIMKNPKYNKFTATYVYYYAQTKTPLQQLMTDVMYFAKTEGGDVLNALTLMHNQSCFEPLRFGKGDGSLHYYLYNWRLRTIMPEQLGIVLV